MTAVADDASPVATIGAGAPSSSPTPIAGTPLPENTSLPTVTAEGSTPIAETTNVSISTAVPTVEVATVTPIIAVTETPLLTPIVPIAPAPIVTAPAPSTPWPSAAEIRQNARLRWGKGIPASVRRWAFLIVPAARRYHLDANLVAAVMTMESNGDPLALSGADARGLMQLLHGPWDPRQNVFQGAAMLADLYAQFADWTLALAAYNAGPGAVSSYGGVPPYRETRDYVIVVNYLWDLYGHHHLTSIRRAQYRKTLTDLRHFADQRKKVVSLAHIAHLPDVPLDTCTPRSCGVEANLQSVQMPDPFWPAGGAPDPLQHVGPIVGQ